jgi:hypothetical protein
VSSREQREQNLIEETLKVFRIQKWTITPGRIWDFLHESSMTVEIEKIVAVIQEQQIDTARKE